MRESVLERQPVKRRKSGTAKVTLTRVNLVLGVVLFNLMIRGLEWIIEILEWMDKSGLDG